MEVFLSFFQDHSLACKCIFCKYGFDIRYFLAVHGCSALLYRASRLGFGRNKSGPHEHGQDVNVSIDEIIFLQLCRRHLRRISLAEQCACALLRLLRFFLAVYQFGQLICQDLFRRIELRALPGIHLIDLLQGKEGQHADTSEHIRVRHISPVLIELERGCLLRVKPYGAGLGLAHLLALGVQKQCDRHGACVLAQLPADQLRTRQHVAPLVVAAELQVAAVFLVQCVEIIRLHDHVVELQEA